MSQQLEPIVASDAPTTGRAWRRWEVGIASAAIIAAVVRLPLTWTPLGDNALMRMWTNAVGTGSTPLVGGDARFGWNHLGPWIFYLMAVPYRLLGSSAVGLLVGAAAINIISLLMVMRCVRAFAGERFAAVIAAGALVFWLTAAGDRLIDPWNPYVAQMPFLLTLVSCWAVLNRQWRWLPWMIGAGSLCMQCHIAFLVPVVVLFGFAVVAVTRAKSVVDHRSLQQALVVAVVAWLPAAIDMFLPHGHNLYRVARFFAHTSSAPTNGLRPAVDVVLRETGLQSSWLGGHLGLRLFTDGFDNSVGILPGVGLVFLAIAALRAWKCRDHILGSIVLIIAALLPTAVVEMALGQGQLFPYLFGWVTIVGMLCWATGLVAILQTRQSPRITGTLATGTVLAIIAVVFTGLHADLPRSPRERVQDAAIVRQLVKAIEPQLSRRTHFQLVHGADAFNSIYELGIVDELRHDGYHVTVDPSAAVLFGRHMTDPRSTTYPALQIVAPFEQVNPGDRVLALSDPLTSAQRSDEASLVTQLTAAYERDGSPIAAEIVRYADADLVLIAGLVHPDAQLQPLLDRLATLRARGRSIAITLNGIPPGPPHP